MSNDPTFVAIIPARGGSREIPRKNIKPLGGKPLLSYTTEPARKSNLLDRIILSTDDSEIARIGRQLDVEIPFERPESLARDETPAFDVVRHALQWLKEHESFTPDYTALLQPTSPFRTQNDIDQALEKLLHSSGKSLISVKKVEEHPFWMYRKQKNRLTPYKSERSPKRRQDLPPLYYPNGALFCAQTTSLLENETLTPGKSLSYEMPPERSLDIDSELDWKIAEALLNENA